MDEEQAKSLGINEFAFKTICQKGYCQADPEGVKWPLKAE
jgi:hypothetical protein